MGSIIILSSASRFIYYIVCNARRRKNNNNNYAVINASAFIIYMYIKYIYGTVLHKWRYVYITAPVAIIKRRLNAGFEDEKNYFIYSVILYY